MRSLDRPRARRAKRVVLVLAAVLAVLGVSSVVYAATSTVKPDYTLAVSSTSQSIQQGQSANTTVTVSAVGGLTGSVALSATGLPTGATAGWMTPPATTSSSAATVSLTAAKPSGASTLTVQAAKTTPAGTYSISINAVSGTTKHAVTVTLTVTYALNGSFAVSAAPSAGTIAPGGTAAAAVTVTANSGFAGTVALAPYGSLPTGVTAGFAPTSVSVSSGSPSATSTFQLTSSATTPTSTSTVYLVATYTNAAGQKSYQYAQTTLTVSSGGKPFSITSNGTTGLLSPGVSTPVDLVLANPNSQALTVTNLTVQVASTSAGAACDPTNFRVSQYSGQYPVTLASNGSITLSQVAGAPSLPVLSMVNLPASQDGCRGVTINLAYSGMAQGT